MTVKPVTLTPFQQLQNQVNSLSDMLAQLQAAVASAGSGSGGGAAGGVASYPNSLIIPFSYIQTITLAANATQQTNIQLASDSAFELLRMLATTSADVPTNYFNNNFSCLITDQSTGRQMASSTIPQACLVTDSYQFGNDEKYPIIFPAQGIILLNFTNLTAGNLTINFVLKGYKIYQTSPTG